MMNNKTTLLLLALVLVASSSLEAAPSVNNEATFSKPAKPATGPSFDLYLGDKPLEEDNLVVLNYDPIEPKTVGYMSSASDKPDNSNKLKSSSFTVERESSSNGVEPRKKLDSVLAANQGYDAERSGSPNVEKMKDIAMNSRETRLVGPNQREVEMKDDLPTKVVVALENLQKEAKEVLSQVNERVDKGWTEIKKSDVWSQVNDRLDKGWTDFKTMVESVVAPSSANKSG